MPKETRSNGTLYLFAVLTKGAKSLDWDSVRSQSTSVIKKFGLTHYMVPRTATINLLNDKVGEGDESTHRILCLLTYRSIRFYLVERDK